MKSYYLFIFLFIFIGCEGDDDDVDIRNTIYEGHTLLKEEKVFYCESGYRPVFRCPSVCITNKKTILLACHNQETWEDRWGIDILIARKGKDDAKWKKQKIFVTNNEKGRSMSPIFFVDRNSGRIYLFVTQYRDNTKLGYDHTTDEIDTVYKYSDDDGETWSEEISLKSLWNINDYTAVVTSASNGIMLLDGTFLVPMMVIKNHKLYSSLLIKELGKNWRFSTYTPQEWDNECTVYIDNQNQIILDSRTLEHSRNKYIYDLENDIFIQTESDKINSYVAVKAEITRYDRNNDIVYLMSYPNTQTGQRENLSLFGSKDGINWIYLYLFENDYSGYGYSNVTCYQDMVVVTYETFDAIKVIDISSIMDEIISLINI